MLNICNNTLSDDERTITDSDGNVIADGLSFVRPEYNSGWEFAFLQKEDAKNLMLPDGQLLFDEFKPGSFNIFNINRISSGVRVAFKMDGFWTFHDWNSKSHEVTHYETPGITDFEMLCHYGSTLTDRYGKYNFLSENGLLLSENADLLEKCKGSSTVYLATKDGKKAYIDILGGFAYGNGYNEHATYLPESELVVVEETPGKIDIYDKVRGEIIMTCEEATVPEDPNWDGLVIATKGGKKYVKLMSAKFIEMDWVSTTDYGDIIVSRNGKVRAYDRSGHISPEFDDIYMINSRVMIPMKDSTYNIIDQYNVSDTLLGEWADRIDDIKCDPMTDMYIIRYTKNNIRKMHRIKLT